MPRRKVRLKNCSTVKKLFLTTSCIQIGARKFWCKQVNFFFLSKSRSMIIKIVRTGGSNNLLKVFSCPRKFPYMGWHEKMTQTFSYHIRKFVWRCLGWASPKLAFFFKKYLILKFKQCTSQDALGSIKSKIVIWNFCPLTRVTTTKNLKLRMILLH